MSGLCRAPCTVHDAGVTYGGSLTAITIAVRCRCSSGTNNNNGLHVRRKIINEDMGVFCFYLSTAVQDRRPEGLMKRSRGTPASFIRQSSKPKPPERTKLPGILRRQPFPLTELWPSSLQRCDIYSWRPRSQD